MNAVEIDRFGKLICLLGSPHDGERSVAAQKATSFLAQRNLVWSDVVEMLKHPPAIRREVEGMRSHQQDALKCLGSVIIWKPHEHRFLVQMSNQLRQPTEKQRDWLDGLVDRVTRHENRRAA
ncbi:MAG: hypothetical protein R3E21_08315 [Caenibius sp.]